MIPDGPVCPRLDDGGETPDTDSKVTGEGGGLEDESRPDEASKADNLDVSHSSDVPPAESPSSDGTSRQRLINRLRTDRKAQLIAGGAFLVLLLGVFLVTKGGSHTIEGNMVLSGFLADVYETDAGGCEGGSGFDDLAEGAPVTVRDGDGDIVGTSRLGKSTYVEDGGVAVCEWAFEVEVDDADFYEIEVSHRGGLRLRDGTYSKEELENREWQINAEISGIDS